MKIKEKNGTLVFLLLVLILSGFLFLKNLDNVYLWQDEANTALLAKSVMTTGLPKAYDGVNYFTQTDNEYTGDYLWNYHPWLQYYLAAGSMSLFGVNTAAARLPFVLFGIATLLLLYFFTVFVSGDSELAMVSVFVLLVNAYYIILSRQCRYYPVMAFFSMSAVFAYFMVLKSKKYGYTLLAFSVILLFHTNFLYVPILALSFLAHAMFFRREKIKGLAVCLAFSIAVNIPFYLMFYNFQYNRGVTFIQLLKRVEFYPGYYVHQILEYILPVWLVLCSLVVILIKRDRIKGFFGRNGNIRDMLSFIAIFMAVAFCVLGTVSPQVNFRFLTPLMPFFGVIIAVVMIRIFSFNKFAGAAAVILLMYSTAFPKYLYEINHDYRGPIKGISGYLNEHAKKTDVVAMMYGDMGIKFYTGLKVVLGESLDRDMDKVRNADWVIFRKHIVCERDREARKIMLANINPQNYRAIVIDYPDTEFENREEPDEHMFATDTKEDKVVIFKRK